jgi:hypothetical protein
LKFTLKRSKVEMVEVVEILGNFRVHKLAPFWC